jgi:hypothetical protein
MTRLPVAPVTALRSSFDTTQPIRGRFRFLSEVSFGELPGEILKRLAGCRAADVFQDFKGAQGLQRSLRQIDILALGKQFLDPSVDLQRGLAR